MSEPSHSPGGGRERLLTIAAVVLGLFVLLYSVLVVQQVLAAIALFVWVFVVYLAWRFVRAHERIADAAEQLVAHDDRAAGSASPTNETAAVEPAESDTDPTSPEE